MPTRKEPPAMSYTLRELLVSHISEARTARNEARDAAAAAHAKTEELCSRVECVEREIMGKMGDPNAPSLRQHLKDVRDYVDRQKSRGRWWAGVASASLVGSIVALLKAAWSGKSGG